MNREIHFFKYAVSFFLLFSVSFWIKEVQAFRKILPPRITANAYTGVYTVGQADLMLSIDGDSQHNFYVNPQGSYGSDQQWLGDVGLGYRWIKNNAAIIGWYVFAGHTRVANNSSFWITNPGVELMGSRWDGHINAYIPMAGRSYELGIGTLSSVSQPFFTGHTEIINTVFTNVNRTQQIGNGIDAKAGYQLFRQIPLKAYLGAYLFAIPNTNNLLGGATGAEYWFDHNVRAFVSYTYDNYQHSKVVGGLGVYFGGVRRHWADPSLSERLTDPVERYLANLGHGSPIPNKTILTMMGTGSRSQLITDDIAFFSQTGMPNNGGVGLTLANCTFENPCGPTDFSQTGVNTLDTLLPDTLFYFNGGSYPAVNGGSALTLNNGQAVFSRTADYSAAASGSARSTFNGGFILTGNNQLIGVILNNSIGLGSGVNMNNAQNVQISNTQIGSAGNRYVEAVSMNNSLALLTNSTTFSSGSGMQVTGSIILIQSSTINGVIDGVSLSNSIMQMNDSQVNVVGNNPFAFEVAGIGASGSSVVDINRSNINVQSPTKSVGLFASSPTQMQMDEGSIVVSGDNSSLITEGIGTTIPLQAVICVLNGVEGC